MTMVGPAVIDLTQHFVERWNFSKPSSIPSLLALLFSNALELLDLTVKHQKYKHDDRYDWLALPYRSYCFSSASLLRSIGSNPFLPVFLSLLARLLQHSGLVSIASRTVEEIIRARSKTPSEPNGGESIRTCRSGLIKGDPLLIPTTFTPRPSREQKRRYRRERATSRSSGRREIGRMEFVALPSSSPATPS
jgi:phosphatidylserine/phosphatidylglycerophosphate/cardiolipin synthase-like enzyme